MKIERIGVIGAGTMGAAIAQHFAMKGLKTTIVDLKEDSLKAGIAGISASLEEAVSRKILRDEAKTAAMACLNTTTKLADLADTDLVIEAVFENKEVKTNLFRDIEAVVSNRCVIASNTSSFSISDLAADMKRPQRFVGVHYFYHAAKNKLIEIISGEKTEPEVCRALMNFYHFNDKLPVQCLDVSGFVINRFFVPWLNEAVRLHEENLGTPTEIDAIAKKAFRIGMGPFGLMNATGVPIAMHAASGLAEKFGKFYEPAAALVKQVEKGEDWSLSKDAPENPNEKIIRERLLAASLGVAAQMISEGVTDASSADLATRVGLRWSKGPFEMINKLGLTAVAAMVKELFQKWDLSQPEFFEKYAAQQKVPLQQVNSYAKNGVGYIAFNRPDTMNALNEDVVSQLKNHFEKLDKNNDVKRIVLRGIGKAFVAGADIKFFVDNIKKDDIDRIYSFTNAGQQLLQTIENSSKETVAYLDGLTLGGGLELALACDYRIGTKRCALGFPETGIGIYPGLGGTQRTPRLLGKGLAKYLIATGQIINGKKAAAYGLIDDLIDRIVDIEEFADLKLSSKTKQSKEDFPEATFDEFSGQISDDFYASELGKNFGKALSRKAPLALATAMQLVDEGGKLPSLNDGLDLELSKLKEIFKSKDALVGLESVMTRQKPSFTGA